MVTESKYYTPTIDEFHVGFEFEYFKKGFLEIDDRWVKSTVNTTDDLDVIDYDNTNSIIRVKYLDREDIESLGWEFWKQIGDHNFWFLKDGFYLCWRDNNLQIDIDETEINRFLGTIKNKSELKRIMKQIGIK